MYSIICITYILITTMNVNNLKCKYCIYPANNYTVEAVIIIKKN